MSQAGIINIGAGPVPPTVATSYVTDNGTAIPALNVLNVNGGSVTTDNVNGIETRANPNASNNLEIDLTNRLTGSGTSTNASVVSLITFSLAATAQSYRFNFDVVGRETTTGDTVGYSVDGTAKTNAAVASLVATPFIDNDEDASLITANIDLVVSGNNVILQATGVAGTTITYKAVGLYVVV